MRADFESEVVPHLAVLRRLAISLVRDPMAAEDLVQDALLRACRFWHLYQPGTAVRPWLMTILRHCFINDYRKARRSPVLTGLDERTRDVDARPQRWVDGERETAALTDPTVIQVLEELSPKHREALLLSDLEGLSLLEISDRLGVPVGTTKSRIFRARRAARARLGEHALAMGYLTRGQIDSGRRVA